MTELLSQYAPYIAISVVLLAFLIIFFDLLRPASAFLVATVFLLTLGILTPQDLLAGLANPSIISVVLLILLTTGFRKNFNLEALFDKLMGTAHNYRQFLLRMMAQVAVFSSFINNTPVVTFMVPYVFEWAKRRNISPSKLLIPLSFATILGGMVTIIGTSTTLVLNGFLEKYQLETLNGHEIFLIGGSVTIVGILFLWIFGPKLLPDHNNLKDAFSQNQQEYLAETVIFQGSSLVGKTVQEADLRNLPGVYLAEVLRGDKTISPVSPDDKLFKDDSLIFAGETNRIMELIKAKPGLSLPKVASRLAQEDSQTAEIVIASNSSMIGRRIKDTDFRNRYDAAIIAVNRGGERLMGKIGEIRLAAGDVLLLLVGPSFQRQTEVFRDLVIVSAPESWQRPSRRKTYALALVAGLAILFLALDYFSLFTSLLIILGIMGLLKMITVQDIKRELDFSLVATLILSLALGVAIEKTGAGNLLADTLLSWLIPLGPIPVLIGVLVIATLLTSLVTNVAAVSISFPIVLSIAHSANLDPTPLFLAIAYGASAAFLTPVGYQTNLIVYGPGGYNYRDFLKIGFPTTLIYLSIVVLGIILLYPSIFLH